MYVKSQRQTGCFNAAVHYFDLYLIMLQWSLTGLLMGLALSYIHTMYYKMNNLNKRIMK